MSLAMKSLTNRGSTPWHCSTIYVFNFRFHGYCRVLTPSKKTLLTWYGRSCTMKSAFALDSSLLKASEEGSNSSITSRRYVLLLFLTFDLRHRTIMNMMFRRRRLSKQNRANVPSSPPNFYWYNSN